jgi:hypothetical protein
MRQYYLTTEIMQGDEPDGTDGNGAGVCASGYHFASMWEILDPSNLKYNTVLGHTKADSGQGPPSYVQGWVRTGNVSSTSDPVGMGNCANWTSNQPTEKGPHLLLDPSWDTAGNFPGWVVEHPLSGCASNAHAWCVED